MTSDLDFEERGTETRKSSPVKKNAAGRPKIALTVAKEWERQRPPPRVTEDQGPPPASVVAAHRPDHRDQQRIQRDGRSSGGASWKRPSLIQSAHQEGSGPRRCRRWRPPMARNKGGARKAGCEQQPRQSRESVMAG